MVCSSCFRYLSELVVDHHVVGLHVPVHDPHTVTVVQGLRGQTCSALLSVRNHHPPHHHCSGIRKQPPCTIFITCDFLLNIQLQPGHNLNNFIPLTVQYGKMLNLL